VIEARFAGSPVLHITGMTMTKFADRDLGSVHDPIDQLGMMRSVCKAAYRIRSAQQALRILTRAATEALTAPTGPSVSRCPIDLQRVKMKRPACWTICTADSACRTPDRTRNDELASRVKVSEAADAVDRFRSPHRQRGDSQVARHGLHLCQQHQRQGHRAGGSSHDLGGLHGNGMPGVQEFYATCDLLLAVGTRLRARETGDLTVKLPSNIVHIDCDPAANGRTYPDTYFVLVTRS